MRTVIKVWATVALLAWACSSEKTENTHETSNAGNAGNAASNRGTIVGAIQ